MSLELLKENDPQLLEVSEPWDFEVDGDPSALISDMTEVMTRFGGVGLAAPQCGVSKRIFIMGVAPDIKACINPLLVYLSEERILDVEGCLSFPELWMKVKRPGAAIVKYQDVSGKEIEETLMGLQARIFLHEYDHLVGITFDQRVGNLTLKMAREKRKKWLGKLPVLKTSV